MRPAMFRAGLCSLLAVGSVCSSRADEKAAALIRDVQTATRAAKSLTAEISLSQSGQGRDMKATGTVKLQKPNMARIEFGAPIGLTVASDGKDMFMFMKQANMYQKTAADPNGKNIDASLALQVPLFFSDTADAAGVSLAKAIYGGTEKRGATEYRVLEIVKGEQKFRFFVAPSNIVSGFVFEVKQGAQTIKIESFYSNVKLNEPIPATAFSFKPPQTAKLYEEPNYEAKLLKVGTESPPFELTNPKDKTRFSLAKTLDGRKAVLVNFWFYN